MEELLVPILLLLVGMVIIIKGGDLFVDAASWMAQASGVPTLIVGATVVSLATAMPELLVSTMAASQGKVDMSIGNAAGSVTVNTAFILALSLLFMPSAIKRRDYIVKFVLLFSAAAIVMGTGLTGQIGVPVAVVLLCVFVAFMVENISRAKSAIAQGGEQGSERPTVDGKTIVINIVKFALGTAGIVLGADLLVDNASLLASSLGVSERIISVTIVAIGTSLPELVTTVTALIKKQSALSVGNIVGANILNLTLIMPLSAIVSGKPMPVTHAGQVFDLPVVLLVSLVAFVPAIATKKFHRWQGAALMGIYAVYLFLTCTNFALPL